MVALAVMVSLWGLVNIVRGTIPFGSTAQPNLPTFNPSGGSNPTNTNDNGIEPEGSNPLDDRCFTNSEGEEVCI